MSDVLDWATGKAPLFQVVGAIIILVSWIGTNIVSERLRAAASALDRVTADDDLRQRMERIRRGYSEMKATLDRLELLVSELNPTSIFSALPSEGTELRDTYGLMQTAKSSFIEHEDLQEVVSATRKLQGGESLPSELREQLAVATRTGEELLAEYDTAVRTWDAQRESAVSLIRAGETDTALLQRATSEYILTAGGLHGRFREHRTTLLDLHGKALGYLVERLNSLRRTHRIAQTASWYLYAVGTVLVIGGGWLESRA